jgi:signal transduction histidine kinase
VTALPAARLPGMLGHELRNPLAAAVTGASVLREMFDGDDPRLALVDGVLRDLDRMTQLTDGWLRLAQKRLPGMCPVDLATVLARVAARHGAELVSCPAEAAIDGNAALLERCFDNLCENARHAGAQSIRFAVQSLGTELCVHVEDDGAGVAPAVAARMFQAGVSSRGSAGLGLAAVATTLATHRGSIRHVALARGTRFTVTLPARQPRSAEA